MVDVPRLSATTHAFRALWLAVGTAALVWRRGANALVQEAWDVLRASAIVRHDSFEPGVVVVAFLFCLVFWKAMDCWLPEGWTRPWRLQDSADLGSWKIEKRGFRLLQEPAWYFAPLLVFDYLFPRRKLPASAPSVEQLVVEVLAALVVYDLLFFFVHVICHKVGGASAERSKAFGFGAKENMLCYECLLYPPHGFLVYTAMYMPSTTAEELCVP
ncbi:unnamed protein product [Ostreobium quekettii]|uniref:Uncharacterized protein n=1 Tax=Ostreobium quekettii TaxID=121088 RepID=A0A8S1INJ0_9CHLO|nr:unnamed protein product [Ostreobium quekettii]